MKKILIKTTGGFSLIELILYVAIVSIFLVGMTNFIWDIIYGRQKAHAQQVVEQSARVAMGRINYELRRAANFNVISSTELQLTNPDGTTSLLLNGNTLQITTPGGGPYDLTNDKVIVSNLNFSEFSSSNTDSKQLNIELSIDQAQDGAAAYDASISLAESIELNSAFNQSRSLLIDLSGVVASANNRSIEGITIENTGNIDLTINQLTISWMGTAGGENITQVVLDGNSIWSGSQGSGSNLDLTNYILSPTAGIVNLDSLDFDSRIDGGTFSLEFILGDGAVAKAEFYIEESGGQPSPTPTPSPSSSPSPSPSPSSCPEICQSLGYGDGICRANKNQCDNNGETRETSGSVFCTGGRKADTCCCAPVPSPTPSSSPLPSGTPQPSPTSTPSPTSCTEYCQQNSYTGGTCRKNARTCRNNGETNLSGGNYLCTGGSKSDTCCCAP